VPERFEYTNEVNRRSNTKVKQYEGQRIQRSKEKGNRKPDNTMTNKKRTKGQKMNYKALHRKFIKI
jgi:hypothetical protein